MAPTTPNHISGIDDVNNVVFRTKSRSSGSTPRNILSPHPQRHSLPLPSPPPAIRSNSESPAESSTPAFVETAPESLGRELDRREPIIPAPTAPILRLAVRHPIRNSLVCGLNHASRFNDFSSGFRTRPVFVGRSNGQRFAPRSGIARQASNFREQPGGSDKDDDSVDEDDDGWGSGGSGGGGGGGGGGGRGGDDDKNERRESDDGLGLEEEEPEETVLQTLDVGLAPAPNPFINYLPKKAEKVAGLRSSIRWSAEQLPRILDHSAPADWKRNTSFGRWMERIRNSH